MNKQVLFSVSKVLETDIMYWLAINRELVILSELRDDITSPVAQSKLLEAIANGESYDDACGGLRQRRWVNPLETEHN